LKIYRSISLCIIISTCIIINGCGLSISDSEKNGEKIESQEVINPSITSERGDRTSTVPPPQPGKIDSTPSPTKAPSTATITVSVTPIIPTPSSSPSPTPTKSSTPTITPTYSILRGQVIPERVNCRYGPGASYLYKYGLVGGSNLEIIGRIKNGSWILIQAIGGDNPCWVKADLMDIRGEIFSVKPVSQDLIQAWSPYYPPLTGVSAVREGSKVTIFWHPLILRAGDDAEQVPYIIETWTCQDGEIVFIPYGAFQTAVEITDETGCDDPSHGQVLAAEKHGYTRPVEIQWPSPNQ
jgi:hypothetical protein